MTVAVAVVVVVVTDCAVYRGGSMFNTSVVSTCQHNAVVMLLSIVVQYVQH